MKTFSLSIGSLLVIIFLSCSKNSNSAAENTLTLSGKWTLIETLADPGDGSGRWTPVDNPNYYYIQFNVDKSLKGNALKATRYMIVNDSVVTFFGANNSATTCAYKIANSVLTISGGCDEACGSKFKRATPFFTL